MTQRRICPSCSQRLSPYAAECPVCGLRLATRELPRPLLFQARAIHGMAAAAPAAPRVLSAPALGRVSPLDIEASALPSDEPQPDFVPIEPEEAPAEEAPGSTFGRLLRLEVGEALLLAAFNLLLALLSGWMTGGGISRTYAQLWPFLLPVHLCTSWSLFMVPLVLSGQSPLMGPLGILLEAPQPELRMSYSLFHLLSVVCWPISFLCMVLTPAHHTLAELLTGQELILYARSRMR